MQVQAARPRQSETGRPAEGDAGDPSDVHRAKPAATSGAEILLARYPEWDQQAGIERPDWTCVREVPAALGDPAHLEEALARLPELRRRLDRQVRAARPGRPVRLRRQPDGPDLDLDAVIDAATARTLGQQPDERVYRASALRTRDVATAVLLDVSESMRARLGMATLLDIERIAVALLADALSQLGDPFAMFAFASDGREAVRLTRVKDFAEAYGPAARARLMGLRAGLSTRLGTAIRHAGAEIARVRSFRRLVLVLSDAEPSDIDVSDPRDLVEDARRAALTLRARGIDTFGVTLAEGAEAASVSARIFGLGGIRADAATGGPAGAFVRSVLPTVPALTLRGGRNSWKRGKSYLRRRTGVKPSSVPAQTAPSCSRQRPSVPPSGPARRAARPRPFGAAPAPHRQSAAAARLSSNAASGRRSSGPSASNVAQARQVPRTAGAPSPSPSIPPRSHRRTVPDASRTVRLPWNRAKERSAPCGSCSEAESTSTAQAPSCNERSVAVAMSAPGNSTSGSGVRARNAPSPTFACTTARAGDPRQSCTIVAACVVTWAAAPARMSSVSDRSSPPYTPPDDDCR